MEHQLKSTPSLKKALGTLSDVLQNSDSRKNVKFKSGNTEFEIPQSLAKLLMEIADGVLSQEVLHIAILDNEFTTQQAADYLDISRPTLIKMINAFGLEVKLVGRHRRLTRAQLKFLSDQVRQQQENAIREDIREEQLLDRAKKGGLSLASN